MSGRFGKPVQTGRSSGQHAGKLQKIHGPPAGESWCWFTRELLLSPAWRALSPNARKLVDFLCVEHCNHAGQSNGLLKATYDQLNAYGLTRELISLAIDEAEALGLIAAGVRLRRIATTYRLTFYATHDHIPPTNEWEKITDEHVQSIKRDLSARRKNRNLVR